MAIDSLFAGYLRLSGAVIQVVSIVMVVLMTGVSALEIDARVFFGVASHGARRFRSWRPCGCISLPTPWWPSSTIICAWSSRSDSFPHPSAASSVWPAALLIAVPLFGPLVVSFGVDPIQFGVVLTFAIMLGIVHPPIGLGIFAVCAVTRLPMEPAVRATLLFYPVLMLAMLPIMFVPALSTWLPALVFPGG